MEQKNSVLENFLNDSNETPNPFEDNLKDPFAPQETEVQTPEEPKEEKPLPFHKDPKVLKFIDKEVTKRIADIKPSETSSFKKETEDDDFYERLIGNDTPEKLSMVKEYKAREQHMLEKAEERAFGRLTKESQAQIQADKDAEAELENAFESIEEAYDVDLSSNNQIAKKTRQEFGAYVEKLAPKDKEGNVVAYPDMNAAWETFQMVNKQAPSRAKELASRGMARSTVTVPQTQKRVDWNSVDEMFDNLK